MCYTGLCPDERSDGECRPSEKIRYCEYIIKENNKEKERLKGCFHARKEEITRVIKLS